MTSILSHARPVGFAIAAMGAAICAPASAAVVLTEGTFATDTYALSSTYAVGGDIMVGQCQTCGDPTQALRFNYEYTGAGAVSLGVTLNNLSYDTALGAVSTIDVSLVKNLIRPDALGPTSNYIRPMIEQDGRYYLAEIFLGLEDTPVNTGFLTGSATFSAANFLLYDFATATFGIDNPDFASGVLKFGIAQISTGSGGAYTVTTIYDNYQVTITSVPEPASWAMMIGGFALAGAAMRRRTARTSVAFA